MIATLTEGKEEFEKFVFAIVRGDMEVNETKLANAVKANALRPATDAEIRGVGAVPGYASPIGLQDVLVVVDDQIPSSPNLVAGANEEGFHMRNVNYDRDYKADFVIDIAAASEGDACPVCGTPMRVARGIEVGNIFKLGTRYSADMGCTFLDRTGEKKLVLMGSYGIGSGRLLASVAEAYHDEFGLMWPITVAPYQVHMVSLKDATDQATRIYDQLCTAGIETLFDDRDESAGVKFNDADLVGIPLRLTISTRSLAQQGVELKHRSRQEREIVPVEGLVDRITAEIRQLEAEIQSKVVVMPFEGGE